MSQENKFKIILGDKIVGYETDHRKIIEKFPDHDLYPIYHDPNPGDFYYKLVKRKQYKSELTKREYFSAMAMQGLLANSNLHRHDRFEMDKCIQTSIIAADELIKQLEP